jgi:hypothetical protein
MEEWKTQSLRAGAPAGDTWSRDPWSTKPRPPPLIAETPLSANADREAKPKERRSTGTRGVANGELLCAAAAACCTS